MTTAGPGQKQRALIVAGIAVAVICGITVYQGWRTHIVATATAHRDVEQITNVFTASSDVTIQSVELLLDHAISLVHQLNEAGQQARISEQFIAATNPWPFIAGIAVTDVDGITRNVVMRGNDGDMQATGVDLERKGWPVHQHHLEQTDRFNDLFISPPKVPSVSDARWILMSKRISNPDGSFAGVCFVSVKASTFERLFKGLLPAKYASVGLFRQDGVLLAGSSDAYPHDVLSARESATESISYQSVGRDNKTEYLVASRALPRYPVVVSVSALKSAATAPWWSEMTALCGCALTGILLIMALTAWHIRRVRQEEIAQGALADSERNLAESQKLAGIGHYNRDPKARDYDWAENMYEIHGVTRSTYIPSRAAFIEMVVPEDRARLKAFHAAIDNGLELPDCFECRIVHPDGTLRHMRYNWRVLESENGRLSRVFGIAQDVSEIRAAEATIRDDQERLRDIVECSSDYIWESDAAGNVTLFSTGHSRRLGVIGNGENLLSDAAAGETGDMASMRAAIADRVKFRNLVVPSNDSMGNLRWIRVSANPRFNMKGEFVGYRGAGTDVTERRQQQERAEDQRRDEAIGRLAGGVAHEINNLLQPILIYATFGSSQIDIPEKTEQYFTRIARAAERATMIVKNVLTSARQSPPVRENANVCELARETIDLLGEALAPGNELLFECEADDIVARVDRMGLAQLLTNLVTNADEALSQPIRPGQVGRIMVNAGIEHMGGNAARNAGLSPGHYCRLTVSDNGPGIEREYLNKVFEPFFTTKPQGKGTGLGLSVVHGLAKSWGGVVTVVSLPGEYTSFSVYLPLAERQLQAAQ